VVYKTMIQRKCPECMSELVRARSADTQRVTGMSAFSSPGWRCSVCGREFTTEQIRESKRSKSSAVEPA
jgi:DNA-directed RNA polymerase subunit RPC12/RpoP